MGARSRSSLRGTVRRKTDDVHLKHDRHGLPMKRQRTLHDLWPVNRRRSSPDCLDATTPTQDSVASKARHVLSAPDTSRPPTLTHRSRRASSPSSNSVASNDRLSVSTTPRVNHGDGVTTPAGDCSRRATATATTLLRDDPESPDPLDTISPAVKTKLKPTRSGLLTRSLASEPSLADSPTAKRSTRRNDSQNGDSETKKAKASAPPSLFQDGMTPLSPDTRPANAPRPQEQKPSEPHAPDQDSSAAATSERRSLRSADTGSRCKSELAQYFHNYEQIISLDEPEPELLAFNTVITVVDNLSEPLPTAQPDPSPFGNPLRKLHDCKVITLPEPAPDSDPADPLTEDLYFRAHRRFERQEKHLRNIERDRAQHEKQHLDRLLEELQSPDWLRVMGLTGVHENEKKLYEPKRKILVDELVALVNKFQKWKDEERKRKTAKDKHLHTGDAEPDSQVVKDTARRPPAKVVEDTAEESSALSDALSTPDPSDVDALAARQLHQEARSASVAKQRKSVSEGSRKPKTKRSEGGDESSSASAHKTKPNKSQSTPFSHDVRTPAAPSPPPPPAYMYIPPPPDKPFTSFFEDSHQRELAVATLAGSQRDRTHTVLAFGQPLPEMPEREFLPPEAILTDEALHASQRQRRLLKRRNRG
ncbi:hypothetical protein N7539_008359 [Penicillium diatomitis]|uniref:Something about silencing protein 4 domain-containing protein n=1 Tax=Penicillium diatomitis TaxID=2819901 RepID=A0A9W9WTP9_9EURO|nr:uncharacterized protein N7539_008359 [Penicillium diatomitis]KAJ5475293.1 hypothetical protein N7539_008359 [Penicillium diatomitis]